MLHVRPALLLSVVLGFFPACTLEDEPGREGENEPPAGNVAPVAFVTSVQARTPSDSDVVINVSAFDEEEAPLSLVVDVPPGHGRAIAEEPAAAGASPSLRYAPDAGFAGQDTFTLRVFDGELESAEVIDVRIDVIGRSCVHILNSGGSVGDGVYLVDLTPDDDTADEDEVFCDMSTDGGGWTLALKVAGDADTFCYDAPLWTDDTLLNATSADETPVEAKLAPYLMTPVGELLVEMSEIVDVAAPSTQLVIPLAPEVAALRLPLRDLLAIDATHGTTLGAGAWEAGLFARYADGLHDGTGGLNVVRDATSAVRIGQLGSAALSSVGVGMRSGACVEGGIDLVTAGARLALSEATPIAAHALVSVRSRDFTFLPPRDACADHAANGAFLTGTYLVDEDGPGGESPQPVVCPFGDMRHLVLFERDGVAPDDECPAPFVADASGVGCIAAAPDNVVSLIVEAPLPFTRVQGRIEAVARGDLEAFGGGVQASLDNVYVDGVSVTVGDPRTHVFTMAVGTAGAGACPCGTGAPAPAYVGEGMLCEDRPAAGPDGDGDGDGDDDDDGGEFDVDNVLFDDDARNAACTQAFVPHEFDVALPAASTGPIEVRVMVDGDDPNEAIALQRLEIRVR
jgi:hypothetical protein